MAGVDRLRTEESREIFREALARTAATRQPVHDVPSVHRDPVSGEERYYLSTITPILDGSGQVVRFRGVVREVTEVRKMRAALAEKEALALVGQMAATIAHEIRNPLGGISGAIELLSPHIPPELQRVVKEIQLRLARLNGIVEEFLSYAKPVALRLDPARPAALVAGAVDILRHDTALAGISFQVTHGNGDPIVRVDQALLQQALTNILINAAQAMGGRGTVRIRLECVGPTLMIEVADHGPGIPKEAQRRIFEPFYSTKHRGTGLGLPITKKIVEAHGGCLEVESEVGQGTVFRIAIPIA